MGTRDAVRSGRPWICRSCNERAAEIDLGGTDFLVKTLRVIGALAEPLPGLRRGQKTACGSVCYGRLAVLPCECQKKFWTPLELEFFRSQLDFARVGRSSPEPYDILDLAVGAVGTRRMEDAMEAHVHSPLRSRGPSLFDWVMLALSFLTVSWIVVAF
jgi:hypothetical protein